MALFIPHRCPKCFESVTLIQPQHKGGAFKGPAKAILIIEDICLFERAHMGCKVMLLGLLLFLSGCVGLGPDRIEGERTNYNTAIQRTNDEQLLLNLVRLKYRDTPFFMEVSSVATQFSFTTLANANATVPEAGFSIFGFGTGAALEEKPTVTYSPLQGDKFIQRVLSPISLQTVALLYHSGWRVDRLFRLCFQRLNKVKNAPNASGPTPAMAPEFADYKRAVKILSEFRERDLMELEYRLKNEVPSLVIQFDESVLNSVDLQELSRLLGAKPVQGRYLLGAVDHPKFIRIQTRSLLGIMYYLSHGVEVPERDVKNGKVTVTHDEEGNVFDWSRFTEDLLRIQSKGELIRESTAVAVRYRGTWFYIDDSDLNSKSTFSLLAQIFSLQAGGVPTTAPLLTLPIGR